MISAIFDLDGTLCEVSEGRRNLISGPGGKDYDTYHEDAEFEEPNRHIRNLCLALSNSGYNILISTGRPERYRNDTMIWLQRQGIPFHQLYMRLNEDKRSSEEVKRDHHHIMISAGYEPVIAFDDRASDVALWRELELICCQVAKDKT